MMNKSPKSVIMAKAVDQSVYTFIEFVLDARNNGVDDERIITKMLPERFEGDEDIFRWSLEMINTGIFRATVLSSGSSYPNSNLKIEDDDVLRASFELHWVKLMGREHFEANYLYKNKTSTIINWIQKKIFRKL